MNELASIVIVEDDAVIRAVLEMALAAEGFTEVERVETAREDVQFSLPKNLRADLKATGVQPDRPHKSRQVADGVAVSNARSTMRTDAADGGAGGSTGE